MLPLEWLLFLLPLLRTADEDDPERTAELLDAVALRVDEVLLEEAVALEGEAFRDTEALREADALREKDDTRDEPAMR